MGRHIVFGGYDRSLRERRGGFAAVGIVAGALAISAPVLAEDLGAGIRARIESTFDQVLGNPAELAIPLTRRALARRSVEEDREAASVRELSYSDTGPDEPATTATLGPQPAAPSEDDPEIARLPRPRPSSEPEAPRVEVASADAALPVLPEPDGRGGPLDLVAGAAQTLPQAEVDPPGDAPTKIAAAEPGADEVDAQPVPQAEITETAEASPAPTKPADLPALWKDAATAPADDPGVPAAPTAAAAAASEIVAAPDAPLDLAFVAPVAAPTGTPPELTTSADAAPVPAAGPEAPVATAGPAAEMLASGPCLAPGDLQDRDGDFKRNAAALAEGRLCIAEQRFKERKRQWTIETVRSTRPGPLFAVMHDDEDMSFDNAVAALVLYGGTLVSVDTGGERNQDGIDPNRNFSADGIGCSKLGGNATPRYTHALRKLFDPAQPIIALHNNTGKHIPTGGHGHVSMDDIPKDMESFPAAVDGPLAGERALVLLASGEPTRPEDEVRARTLRAKGVNAVIENVREGSGDCSLSNFAYLTGHRDYLNVTVDEGEQEKQMLIVKAILDRPQTLAQTR